jgi:hypothetical protein
MLEPITISETGCYLDNHRGHYIVRDMIQLAQNYGYIVGSFEQWSLDTYNEHYYSEEYPNEALIELSDDARDWLNCGDNSGIDRAIKGQNSPPIIPDNTQWEWNDGNFGLYVIEDES